MTLWIILLLLTGATVAALLWPLMRAPTAGSITAETDAPRQHLHLAAMFTVTVILPAGTVLLYVWLSAP